MRPWVKILLAVVIIAAITHVVIILASPYLIMRSAMGGMLARTGGANIPLSTPTATATSRAVVKPSPDLAYTVCVYDISQGPVLIGGVPSSAYWSIGLYAANTDNFHVITPKASVGGHVNVVLAKSRDRAEIPAWKREYPVVVPPSQRGIVLWRYLVLDEAGLVDARAAQKTAICQAL